MYKKVRATPVHSHIDLLQGGAGLHAHTTLVFYLLHPCFQELKVARRNVQVRGVHDIRSINLSLSLLYGPVRPRRRPGRPRGRH